jgi:hypothetical protein
MSVAMKLDIPRAAELRPAVRRGIGGRPYIGPKVQVNVPEAHYDAVIDLMQAQGLREEQWADALRVVFAAGVEALGLCRGEA